MALGDLYVLNDAICGFAAVDAKGVRGTTDIDLSDAINKVQLSFENHVTEAPNLSLIHI